MTPRRWTPAAFAVALLISAGCGSGASSMTGSAASASKPSLTSQDKAVKFAECIRQHGVPHFPDPNAKGEFVFGIDVSETVWRNAVNACKALQPPGSLSGKRTPKQQSAALRFAECMRENGVKDFPDPVNGQPLIEIGRAHV